MEAKLVQPLNAPQSINVTLFGISTEIRLVQFSKVPCILVTPCGISTRVKLVQFVKISSRFVMPFDNSTDVRPVQSVYLQPIITQYFIDNKSEIWLLFLIAHSKR